MRVVDVDPGAGKGYPFVMARPLRTHYHRPSRVRRRHRTWVTAMVLATAAWMTWWLAIVIHHFAPDAAPGWPWVYGVSGAFAAAGLGYGLFTVRARTIWVLLAGVPIVANSSLLLVPVLLHDEVVRALAPSLEAPDTPAEQKPGPPSSR